MRSFSDEQGRTSPPASPERSGWRAGVFVEAYRSYSADGLFKSRQALSSKAAGANPRRTPLIVKRAIYGWKLGGYRFFFAVILGLKIGIFPAKPLNASGCIYQLLFACKKGMAFGADFNPYIFFGRACLHHIAARTANRGLKILRMYILLHVKPP
jgi:hypothetical protein